MLSYAIAMYENDLALIHHEGFGDFAKHASPGLLALLASAGIAPARPRARRRAAQQDGARSRVLDLGCGSGIWLAALARAGYAGYGIDASPAMIRLARTIAPRAKLKVGSVHSAALPACDAMTALGEVLSYLPARGAPSLPKLFRKVARALSPRGLFVFDVLVATHGPPFRYRIWRADRSWAVLSDGREDVRRRLLVRDITMFRRRGASFHRTHERHRLRVYRREQVARWLRAAGFTVRTARRYGDFPLLPRRLAFIARKR